MPRSLTSDQSRAKKAEALADRLLYKDLFEQLDRGVFVAEAGWGTMGIGGATIGT